MPSSGCESSGAREKFEPMMKVQSRTPAIGRTGSTSQISAYQHYPSQLSGAPRVGDAQPAVRRR